MMMMIYSFNSHALITIHTTFIEKIIYNMFFLLLNRSSCWSCEIKSHCPNGSAQYAAVLDCCSCGSMGINTLSKTLTRSLYVTFDVTYTHYHANTKTKHHRTKTIQQSRHKLDFHLAACPNNKSLVGHETFISIWNFDVGYVHTKMYASAAVN